MNRKRRGRVSFSNSLFFFMVSDNSECFIPFPFAIPFLLSLVWDWIFLIFILIFAFLKPYKLVYLPPFLHLPLSPSLIIALYLASNIFSPGSAKQVLLICYYPDLF